MYDRKRTLYWYFESWSPTISGVIAAAALFYFKEHVICYLKDYQLSLGQLYTAIFGWASVMTGYQFGIYGLVFSKTDGFIAKMGNTSTMRQFMSYNKRAVILGFVLTISGFPLLMINSDLEKLSNIAYYLGSIYFSMFVCSFSATVRVAKLFAAMANVEIKGRLPA